MFSLKFSFSICVYQNRKDHFLSISDKIVVVHYRLIVQCFVSGATSNKIFSEPKVLWGILVLRSNLKCHSLSLTSPCVSISHFNKNVWQLTETAYIELLLYTKPNGRDWVYKDEEVMVSELEISSQSLSGEISEWWLCCTQSLSNLCTITFQLRTNIYYLVLFFVSKT